MDNNQFLTIDQKRLILKFVREVIAATFDKTALPAFDDELLVKLSSRGSCFVTLHLDGALRGCIGNIEAFEPLKANIVRNAVNSAFRDPRFPPLAVDELAEVVIEVSILTPSATIDSYRDFEIGKHGIILNCRGRSAVFLPQVAVEQNWDRETTLKYLSMKAGLNPDDWLLPDAKFSVFEAIVFSERDES
jgi:AmmeMemoRadiSam system protein A